MGPVPISAFSLLGLFFVLASAGAAVGLPPLYRWLRGGGSRWRIRVLVGAVGSTAFLAALVLGTAVWGVIVCRQLSDTSRCPAISGLRPSSVNVGGWGEWDRCHYRDSHGDAAYPDGDMAGPVDTTPFLSVFAPTLLLAVTAGAIGTKAVLRRQLPAAAARARVPRRPV